MSKAIELMVVDDNPAVREGLCGILEGQPDLKIVGTAASGREALDSIERVKPAVVILDVSMPGMSGIEAARRIKARFPGIAVICLSTYGTCMEAALAAGANAYLLKDCRRADLLNAIREVEGRAAGSRNT